MSYNLSAVIRWWSRTQPDCVAVDVDGASITYRDYDNWADRVAVELLRRGLRIGDRVAVHAANSLEYCVLILGVIRAGGIVAPLSTRATDFELQELLDDLEPALIISDSDRPLSHPAAGKSQPLSLVSSSRRGDRQVPQIDPKPDWPVAIVSTSGSTARPKGVVFTHRTMLGYVTGHRMAEPAFGQGARVLGIGPMSSSSGIVQFIEFTTLGCSFHLMSQFDPTQALHLLTSQRINAFGGVPVLFERISQEPGFAAADLSSLAVATVGGAPVSRALLNTWMEKGVAIRQVYGQTEAGGVISVMPQAFAPHEPEKCGWGGVFTDQKVVRADGSECPPGEPGEILIRGPSVMAGYWRKGSGVELLEEGAWLRTGDLGIVDERGLLTFYDRLKDVIITGGFNVSSAEIERVVSLYAGVEEVAVFPVFDPKFAETPMAVIYAPNGMDLPGLVAHCDRLLTNYKVPRYVEVLDQPLPRLPMGKIAKAKLREAYKDAPQRLSRVR